MTLTASEWLRRRLDSVGLGQYVSGHSFGPLDQLEVNLEDFHYDGTTVPSIGGLSDLTSLHCVRRFHRVWAIMYDWAPSIFFINLGIA